MKKIMLLIGLLLMFTFTGCSEADRASHNVSKQADSFNVLRQITVINNITGDVMM